MNDTPHLIREAWPLDEQTERKLTENNHTMKEHLERTLKQLEDNLQLMIELREDSLKDQKLKLELSARINERMHEIHILQTRIASVEGRFANSANV